MCFQQFDFIMVNKTCPGTSHVTGEMSNMSKVRLTDTVKTFLLYMQVDLSMQAYTHENIQMKLPLSLTSTLFSKYFSFEYHSDTKLIAVFKDGRLIVCLAIKLILLT